MAVGFATGFVEDIKENDKTVGQAITHNSATTLAGAASGAIIAAFLPTNPVGWAIIGVAAATIAVGTVASVITEFAYQDNLLGFQDSLDYVGGKFDNLSAEVKKYSIKEVIE